MLAALPPAETGARRSPTIKSGLKAHGLRVWQNLPEWQERAPPPAARQRPGLAGRSAAASRRRCSAPMPRRGRSRPITPPRSPPPSRRASSPDAPRAVLAEAGTGVGKTLGYIAPASLWAEKNQGTVWISTYTRNLQSQIDGELDRLYPGPGARSAAAS